tara:strand:- start:67 stop:783 length:717 start_codon:yes stop_codon:yes gene_type:complete
MSKKPEHKFQTNIKNTIAFLYDKPMTGTNEFGEWSLYSGVVDGEEKVFYATQYLASLLKDFGKGDVVEITREEDGNKTRWNVIKIGEENESKNGEIKQQTYVPDETDWDTITGGKSFVIIEQTVSKNTSQIFCSLIEAGIEKTWNMELWGKIFDDQNSFIQDCYGRVLSLINRCEHPNHLNNLMKKQGQIWKSLVGQDAFAEIEMIVEEKITKMYQDAEEMVNAEESHKKDKEKLPFE